MPTITVRFSDIETIAAIGYLRGSPDDPTRAQPTAAAAVRKAILFAAKSGLQPPATGRPELPLAPLAPVLDAWAALCAGRGRVALTTHDATSRPCHDLEAALAAVGYPLACRSPRTLAQTFRHLGQRPCPDGRQLCRSEAAGEGGRMSWYVSGGPSPSPRP